jgi:hypothetical protein
MLAVRNHDSASLTGRLNGQFEKAKWRRAFALVLQILRVSIVPGKQSKLTELAELFPGLRQVLTAPRAGQIQSWVRVRPCGSFR